LSMPVSNRGDWCLAWDSGIRFAAGSLCNENVMARDFTQSQGCFFDVGSRAEPVLVSACLLGMPCRWHGRRAKKREELIRRLKHRYVLVPICPEQLGGMPTPRTGETLHGTGAQVLDEGLRIIAPETGEDVTRFHVDGARYTLSSSKFHRDLALSF